MEVSKACYPKISSNIVLIREGLRRSKIRVIKRNLENDFRLSRTKIEYSICYIRTQKRGIN